MLSTWLEGTSVEDFARDHLRARPLAVRGGARGAVGVLDWDAMARILARRSDALVVAFGHARVEPLPRARAELTALLARGLGLVVRRAEDHCEHIAGLARGFAQELGGAATVQLFATPAGTYGFGWHYDDEDVFIAQTAGAKTYFLRENTVSPEIAASRARFDAVGREVSPVHEARLLAGDWLYVPARWWHVALCEVDALSISVGVRDPSVAWAARPAAV